MNTNRRVVITGMGVVTPVGKDLDTFWRNLRNGVSGIGRIQAFDTSAFDCQIAGEIRDFETNPASLINLADRVRKWPDRFQERLQRL